MSFSNAQLAQKISDLIDYWSSFSVEYADWLGGTVSGGPNSDGEYPLTDYTGTETLVKSPAKLQDDVDNITTGATAQANAAAASAAAASTSETNAAASAATATAQAALADADRVAAELAETNSTNAANTSTTQANLATARAGYAAEWANKAEDSLISVAAGGDNIDDYSALHWSAKSADSAAASAASAAAALVSETNAAASAAAAATFDPALYAALADNETITGNYTFQMDTIGDFVFRRNGTTGAAGIAFRNDDAAVKGYIGFGDESYFKIWKGADASVIFQISDTGNITQVGSITATGAVTGSNLNVSNWDTAYGWGDHAGLYSLVSHNHAGVYEPADATILKDADIGVTVAAFAHNHSGVYEPVDASLVRSGTLTQEDNYTYLNRNNASNPVLHVAQVGAGPIARFGKAPSLGSTAYTAEITFGSDGAITAEGLTVNDVTQTARLNIIHSTSGNTHFNWSSNGENYITHKNTGFTRFREFDGVSTYTTRMELDSTDFKLSLASTGALEITGSSYKTNPAGIRLGQYTSTIGYIQAPLNGKIVMWTDGTAQIAEFNDDLSVNFAGPITASNIPAYNSFTGGAIVTRHGSGYIFSNYFNQSIGSSTTGVPTHIPVCTGSDGYFRWQTLAQLIDNLETQTWVFNGDTRFIQNVPAYYGIDGGYGQGPTTTSFGATIWAIGQSYTGGASGTNSSVTSLYGLKWLRSGHTNYDAEVGEGMYVYQNGTFYGGFGTAGVKVAANSDVTKASHGNYLYHQSSSYSSAQSGGITFSTSAATGGVTGDIWFQYT